MAKKKSNRKTTSTRPKPSRSTDSSSGSRPLDDATDFSFGLDEPRGGDLFEGRTGRLAVVLPIGDPQSMSSAVRKVSEKCDLRNICNSGDYSDGMNMEEADGADVIVFEEFRVAFLNGEPGQYAAMEAAARDEGFVTEPELWNHSMSIESSELDPNPLIGPSQGVDPLDYLRGYRDGLSQAISKLEQQRETPDGFSLAAEFANSAAATWGLQATGVLGSSLSGAGVKVAILDSGFDIRHPDFGGRAITSRGFIPSTIEDRFGRLLTVTDTSATNDRSGHGTHCIGTSCGTRTPGVGPRYGVASGAEIFNGKVLSVLPGTTRASGADAWIIGGIQWAIQNGCSIISMSLGSGVARGELFPEKYEMVAQSALRNGILILAAAGNESDRSRGIISPVGRPANCPSIIAVGAVDRFSRVANFSNRHLNDSGGELNLSGPGVDILSSYPLPTRTRLLSGTSQATPHAAGIAALVQEETGKTGIDLYRAVRDRCTPIGPDNALRRRDYGFGLLHI